MARRKKTVTTKGSQNSKPEWNGKAGSTPDMVIRPKYTKNGVSTEVQGETYEKAPTNDFSFYNRVPGLVDPITRVSFCDRAGDPIPMGDTISSPIVSKGFMVYGLTPSFGWSNSQNSAVNEAAKKIQIYLQRTVSNKLNFDQSDTMIYCMAMAEIYSAIILGQRILGTVNWFDPLNSYLPDALIAAQGVDPKDARNHIADLEYGLNNRIAKLSSMPVPAQLTIMQREAMKYKGYYTEGTSIKDQMYFFAPDYFFMYTENDEGSALQLTPYTRSTQRTVAQFFEKIDSLIDAVVSNGSLREIGGVLLRAFGTDQLIRLEPVPHNYVMLPTFDIVVLEQMKNATIVGSGSIDIAGFGWNQDASTALLYHSGQITATEVYGQTANLMLASHRLLTTTTDLTDPALIMENTRLMATVKKSTATATPGVWEFYTGAEFVSSCNAYVYTYNGFAATLQAVPVVQFSVLGNEASTAQGALNCALVCNNFKFAPALYVGNVIADMSATSVSLFGGQLGYDLDNYAYITRDNLINLHDAAIMSMFYVDMVTTSYR